MRVFLVVPPSFEIPSPLMQTLGDDVVTRTARREGQKRSNLELIPEGIALVLAEPALVDFDQFPELWRTCMESVGRKQAVACVPGAESEQVLSTAAALYAFDARDVHLAGGFDSALPIHGVGLDMQLRLAGRAVSAVKVGCAAITAIPEISFADHLTVLTKNLTSQVQAAYLAPLFTGVIDNSLRATGTDTSALDLQRSPGGDDVPTLSHPRGAFAGAEAVRTWGASLDSLEDSKFITSEARRIPDRRLPYLHAFIDEVWAATGIPAATRAMLEGAFADLRRTDIPEIVCAARSDDAASLARMNEITDELTEAAFWWDPARQELCERIDGQWVPSSHTLDTVSRISCIAYLVGASIREVPWVATSPAILIADFTTTDTTKGLETEWVGHSSGGTFRGAHAQNLAETVERADHIVVRSVEQRDFLLGMLVAGMRLNQYTYDEDPSLNSLISIEDGTRAACSAIARPVHPFERVKTTPEYEKSPYGQLASASESMKETIKRAPLKVAAKLKGNRS